MVNPEQLVEHTDEVIRFEVRFSSLPRKPIFGFFSQDLVEASSSSSSRWESLQTKLAQYLPPSSLIDSVEYESSHEWWVRMNSDRDFAFAMHEMRQKRNEKMKLQVVSGSTNRLAKEVAYAAPPTTAPVVATATTVALATPRTKNASEKKNTVSAKRAITTTLPAAAAESTRPSKRSDSSSVEDRVLTALAELHALRITSPPKIQVALFSNYTNIASTGFANVMRDFSTSGLVTYGSEQTVSLTAAGIEASRERCAVTPPETNAAAHARIQNLLPGKPAQMMEQLADGEAHLCWDVCCNMGYSNVASTGFAIAIRQLHSLGILSQSRSQNGKKYLALTDIAFPFGRCPSASKPPQIKTEVSVAAADADATATRKSERQRRVKKEEL